VVGEPDDGRGAIGVYGNRNDARGVPVTAPEPALQMESYPKFHNEVGVPIVRIGCREFKCIGDKPPQDHPHVYLNMGEANEIVCPYLLDAIPFQSELGRI
jgi:uncharacterized Zn-finger protein